MYFLFFIQRTAQHLLPILQYYKSRFSRQIPLQGSACKILLHLPYGQKNNILQFLFPPLRVQKEQLRPLFAEAHLLGVYFSKIEADAVYPQFFYIYPSQVFADQKNLPFFALYIGIFFLGEMPESILHLFPKCFQLSRVQECILLHALHPPHRIFFSLDVCNLFQHGQLQL